MLTSLFLAWMFAGPAVTDACSLVTKAEVEGTLHEAMKAPQRQAIMGILTCTYASASSPPYHSVRIVTSPASGRAEWEKSVRERAAIVPAKVTEVAGLGEGALFYIGALGGGNLEALKGGRSVLIAVDLGSLGSKDEALKLGVAKLLMTKAVARF
jgi:hypothetical protein